MMLTQLGWNLASDGRESCSLEVTGACVQLSCVIPPGSVSSPQVQCLSPNHDLGDKKSGAGGSFVRHAAARGVVQKDHCVNSTGRSYVS